MAMDLNILATVALLLASYSTEPRDTTDVWVRIIGGGLILVAIWF